MYASKYRHVHDLFVFYFFLFKFTLDSNYNTNTGVIKKHKLEGSLCSVSVLDKFITNENSKFKNNKCM